MTPTVHNFFVNMLHAYFTLLLACTLKSCWWRCYFSLQTLSCYLHQFACLYFLYTILPSLRASLWSSCVVLPLLALTWMSAVLAMTDKRSILFQILFAVFDSLQGFVIVMVHCVLRREVENEDHFSFTHDLCLLGYTNRLSVVFLFVCFFKCCRELTCSIIDNL